MIRLLAIAMLILAGCAVAPKPGVGSTWINTTYGSSMNMPNTVRMVYDYDSVEVGDVCAYWSRGHRVIHRVHGRLHGDTFVMKGDFNHSFDITPMTRNNYLGTWTGEEE